EEARDCADPASGAPASKISGRRRGERRLFSRHAKSSCKNNILSPQAESPAACKTFTFPFHHTRNFAYIKKILVGRMSQDALAEVEQGHPRVGALIRARRRQQQMTLMDLGAVAD